MSFRVCLGYRDILNWKHLLKFSLSRNYCDNIHNCSSLFSKMKIKVKVEVVLLCLTLCDPMGCPWNSPGQNTDWVAFLFSRGSSQPRNQTGVSRITGGFFTN